MRHAARSAAIAAAIVVGLLLVRATDEGPAPAHAQPCRALAAGDHALTVATDAGERAVLLHVPAGGATTPRPLVVALGGAGQTGAQFARDTAYSTLADREHFLVAYPTAAGAKPFWNMNGHVPGRPDDVAFLRAALDRVEDATCVDPSRVYATGVSNGGGMTALLGCELADRLTAIAPVAGGYGTQPACHPSRPLAVLEVHGTADQVVPYAGKGAGHSGSVSSFLAMWRRLDRCTGGVRRVPGVPPSVTELAWWPCSPGADVVHDRIAGERHGWPSWWRTVPSRTTYSTTWRTWAFFRGHARAPSPSTDTAARDGAAPPPG